MLDQCPSPYTGRELRKLQNLAVWFKYQMKIWRKAPIWHRGINRAFVVRVMIAGDHHDRHCGPRNLGECEAECPLANPA